MCACVCVCAQGGVGWGVCVCAFALVHAGFLYLSAASCLLVRAHRHHQRIASAGALSQHLSGAYLTVISGTRAEEYIPAGAQPPGVTAGEQGAGWEEAWHNLLLLQALRPDRLLEGARVFISRVLGDGFLRVPDTDLSALLDTAPTWQLREMVLRGMMAVAA